MATKLRKSNGTFISAENIRPYKTYTAMLTQTGTAAPVATVLENGLGGTVVWTRTALGDYLGTLANAFDENKTHFPAGYSGANQILITDDASNAPNACYRYSISRFSNNAIRILFFSPAGTSVDISDLSLPITVEVRVYN